MLITTFNANSIRTRLPIIIDWIKANQPDVLCIQETKVQDHEFPEAVFPPLGYQVQFRGEKSYNGVAIISKKAPDEITFGFDDGEQPDETRLALARFGKTWVLNTYVPQGREIDHPIYQYKLSWFRRIKNLLQQKFSQETPFVWVGDLNVAPEHIDIHNADRQSNHVCFHQDVRDVFADTLQYGLVDIFRKFHPEPGQFTFFDYRTPNAVKRGMGWRIDHILATPPMANKAQDCFIDLKPRMKPKPSDHTFLSARFDNP